MRSGISTWHLLLFAAPAAVSAIMHGPVAGILPTLYSAEFGLDLAVMGTVLLVARVFDAVTDPLIGYFSDCTESRWGKRKPWVVFGAALTVFSIYFLFRPGEHGGMTYYLAFSLLLYFAWTVMEIPYIAWGLELSRDTEQRAKVNAYRAGALLLGGIVFTLMPSLVPAAGGSMNFEVLGVLAIGIAIAVPLTTLLAVKYVPQGEIFEQDERPRLGELFASLRANKPFQVFTLMYVFIGLASGVSGVVSFMYIDTFLDIGDRYTELFLPAVIIGPITLPFWVKVMNHFGKIRSATVAFVLYALVMPLPWFIQPGPEAFLPMLLYYSGLSVFMPLLMVAMPTILGDVIDYDELHTGKNRAGQYYSYMALIAKGTTAVGGPLAFLALGYFGYQPGAESNDEQAVLGLRLVANILPALLIIPGVYLLWKFPISDRAQRQQYEALEARRKIAEPA
ncbi:MAG: MFS transporter [Pseudomonadota bacterium]